MKNWKLIALTIAMTTFTSGNAFSESETKWYDQIELTAGITAAIQGTVGNNDSTSGSSDDTDYSYTFDLGIESEIAPNHMAIIHIETGDGDGAGDNFATAISPNYDPYNTHNTDVGHQDVTLSQAFYEGTFKDGMITLDIGKMDIHSFTDQNNIAGDETAQFMASIFNRLAGTLYAELDNYYAPGVAINITPHKWLELTFVAANSNNDSLGRRAYTAAQINLIPNFKSREGNYRFYYIRDGRDYTKTNGETDINIGLGVSIDQMITENLGLFFRYGTQDDDLTENTVDSSISVGGTVTGSSWNRADDLLGIGYGILETNNKITGTLNGDQTVIELFYRWQVLERMALTPDIQWYTDLPRTSSRSITVLGVRAQIDF